jgi:hypothetical protein
MVTPAPSRKIEINSPWPLFHFKGTSVFILVDHLTTTLYRRMAALAQSAMVQTPNAP